MLGRLEMGVDECIAAYGNLAETVFGQKLSSLPFNFKGKVRSRFDSVKLEAAVLKVIKRGSVGSVAAKLDWSICSVFCKSGLRAWAKTFLGYKQDGISAFHGRRAQSSERRCTISSVSSATEVGVT
jgi:hypothetical protein